MGITLLIYRHLYHACIERGEELLHARAGVVGALVLVAQPLQRRDTGHVQCVSV